MSDKVQGWVWDLELPPARKLVLLWLAGRATDNGVAFPGEREIRQRTGLCERMVRYHLQSLAADRDDDGQLKQPLLVRVERRLSSQRNASNVYILAVPWQQADAIRRDLDELQHVTKASIDHTLFQLLGATACPQQSGSGGNPLPPMGEAGCPEVGAAGCREESSQRNSHRNTPPVPPSGGQQHGERVLPANESPDPDSAQDEPARKLAEAFYRGIGADASAVTPSLRKRDLVIACQLVSVGASPTEAETYAREMSAVTGRIAPIDLRSFERERLSWQAQRRGAERDRRHLVDRTGQPPSWQPERPTGETADDPSVTLNTAPQSAVRRGPTATDGERLAQALRLRLLRGRC